MAAEVLCDWSCDATGDVERHVSTEPQNYKILQEVVCSWGILQPALGH